MCYTDLLMPGTDERIAGAAIIHGERLQTDPDYRARHTSYLPSDTGPTREDPTVEVVGGAMAILVWVVMPIGLLAPVIWDTGHALVAALATIVGDVGRPQSVASILPQAAAAILTLAHVLFRATSSLVAARAWPLAPALGLVVGAFWYAGDGTLKNWLYVAASLVSSYSVLRIWSRPGTESGKCERG